MTQELAPPPSAVVSAPPEAPRERHALRSVGTVASLTMLSRILGFVRDIIMARQLGLGSVADAFFIAWTLPNLFRRLFGEGALSAAFVPVFVEAKEKGRPDEAARLASAATNRLGLGLTGLVLVLEVFCWLARLETGHALAGEPGFGIASRFSREALEHADLALALSQVLIPYLVFICLSGLLTGALNAMDHFAAPAAAPCVLNIVWIGALLVSGRLIQNPELRVHALSWALLAGGAIQLAMHMGAMKSVGMGLKPVLHAEPEKLRRMRSLFYSVAIGLAVFQVNTFVDSLIAYAFIPGGGGVATLFYANRLIQLPIGTVGIAVATAIFPELSRLATRGDRAAFDRTTDEAMGASFFISLPCSVGLAVLASPIVACLFERGEFDHAATERTARVLLAFAGAVAAGCVTPTITRAFYAEQDAKTPVRVSVVAVIANFVLNLVLVGPLQEAGLALATTISQIGQLMALYVIHARRRAAAGGTKPHGTLLLALGRSTFLCVALGVAARGTHAGLAAALGDAFTAHAPVRAVVLAGAIGAGAIAYLGLAWILGAPELTAMLGIRARRKSRRGVMPVTAPSA
jgi:putative peptidoglycan lipid II flippase